MPGTERLTLALSGSAGSGKSTLAAALSGALGGGTASFGRYVAHLAGLDHVPADRRTLQDFGERTVRADAAAFVRGFVAWSDAGGNDTFIVDGVRHVAVDDELRRWSAEVGRAYVLVHVAADPDLRAARRTKGDSDALASIDAHPVEGAAETSLPIRADVRASTGWLIDSVVADVLAAAGRSGERQVSSS